MSSAALAVRSLACGRGERALFDTLSFSAKAGQIIRIAGDNGAGKTTLLRTLAGLLPPIAGDIVWHVGTRIERPGLCFIDHDNALSGVLSPVENLALLCRLAGHAHPVSERQIIDTLAALGLKRLAHRPCKTLSAGQKRRVALARLWLSAAPVWLLDEPAGALDVDSRARLAAFMQERAGAGVLIVYTTHEPLGLTDDQTVALA